MKTVSFQGVQLTSSQRRRLADQQRVAFLNPDLAALVRETETAVAKLKEQGAASQRLWTTERTERGTPWLGDVFGY